MPMFIINDNSTSFYIIIYIAPTHYVDTCDKFLLLLVSD